MNEKVITTTCSYDCEARCLLKVNVAGCKITRILTDDQRGPGLKACIRRLSQKHVVYAPDRLTRPLKRIGRRGSGAFGEQFHRTAMTLAAMAANIGTVCGHVAGGTDRMELGKLAASLPVPPMDNPQVHVREIYDTLLRGAGGGYPADIKLLCDVGCNILNQFLNIN